MEPAILVFTWFWLNHPPVGSQIAFPSMALCQEARQNLVNERKQALNKADDSRQVAQLFASCVATAPTAPTAPAATHPAPHPVPGPVTGIDWLMAQPVNLLDWGLQRLANSTESIRSVTIASAQDGVPARDVVDVDFSLVDSGQFKFTIQGTINAKSPAMVTEGYCLGALKAWRRAVLQPYGDNPSSALEAWFSHADRNGGARPQNLAETVSAAFEFRVLVNSPDQQPGISCATPFAIDPQLAARAPTVPPVPAAPVVPAAPAPAPAPSVPPAPVQAIQPAQPR
jgi:hypothetical protein